MVQKGVTKGLKEHLLQAKRALFASRFVVFTKSVCEKIRQKKYFQKFEINKFYLLHLGS